LYYKNSLWVEKAEYIGGIVAKSQKFTAKNL